jgi:hypothetical protein
LILNLFVSVDLAIAVFALVVGSYAALKAYAVDEGIKSASVEQKYELEKSFNLVSTVGWLTMGTRLLAIPLFWISILSLIPSVPGAMCEFGVFQAGAPFSWADLGIKLFTVFAFGGWLFFDLVNRRLKDASLTKVLSRAFVLLLPLLFIDAILDIAFFGTLKPLVVPCCMVAYPNTASSLFNIGCPFCYVTYKMPLLMLTIPAYAVAAALLIWSFLLKRYMNSAQIKEQSPVLSKALLAAIILAVIGTVALIVQFAVGPLGVV